MTRRTINLLLLAAAAGLALAALAVWLWPWAAERPEAGLAAPAKPAVVAASPVAPEMLEPPGRDIFQTGQGPVAASVAQAELTVLGVVLGPSESFAVVRLKGQEGVQRLYLGARLGNRTVVAIDREALRLTGPGGVRESIPVAP